jgi:acetyl esterase/lipase
MDIFTRQPFKGLYLLSALAFELTTLPYILITSLTSSTRPHPQWTFRQSLMVRVIGAIVKHTSIIQVKTPLPLSPDKENEQFVVIEPASSEYYTGPLLSNPDVKPIKIGATWYPAPLTRASKTENVTVILHIHGGAFVVGDGRKQATGFCAHQLLKHAGATHVFAPQYRLSSLPTSPTSNPFPAALQDSLTAYMYLVETLGISPANIVLSGDSAGGNLSIALLRYIGEHGSSMATKIPTPSAALLWSPWVEPTRQDTEWTVTNRNYATDYLSASFVLWGSRAYMGNSISELIKSPYIAVKDAPFKTDVPLFMNTGGAEVLFFDDVEWAEGMKKAGSDVTVDIEDKVPHDILLVGDMLGFQVEATAMARRAGEWLKSVRRKV